MLSYDWNHAMLKLGPCILDLRFKRSRYLFATTSVNDNQKIPIVQTILTATLLEILSNLCVWFVRVCKNQLTFSVKCQGCSGASTQSPPRNAFDQDSEENLFRRKFENRGHIFPSISKKMAFGWAWDFIPSVLLIKAFYSHHPRFQRYTWHVPTL